MEGSDFLNDEIFINKYNNVVEIFTHMFSVVYCILFSPKLNFSVLPYQLFYFYSQRSKSNKIYHFF